MSSSAPTQWQHKVLFCALAALVGCHTGASQEADPDRADPRASDSLRSAQAERGRSSATQGIDFTLEERLKFNRVEQMLQARFAGVQVLPSGGGYSITIRGSSSLGTSRSEPLIIIDGASRSTGDLGNLSPREVQRIEVMKDGAASIYGSRGSNGVIRITTVRSSP
jgi:TonB-dependent SusC/RagA subfamily outer membrane receptor